MMGIGRRRAWFNGKRHGQTQPRQKGEQIIGAGQMHILQIEAIGFQNAERSLILVTWVMRLVLWLRQRGRAGDRLLLRRKSS
jgi:hypothetical protein